MKNPRTGEHKYTVPEIKDSDQKRSTFGDILRSDPLHEHYRSQPSSTAAETALPQPADNIVSPIQHGSARPWESSSPSSTPMWNLSSSPFSKSPWSSHVQSESFCSSTGLVGSLVREEGHIYSLAASGDLLYTGSDSKNIRVWKNQKEFSGFKSNSGLVKAIIIVGERILSGHQDGKIRVWKVSRNDPSVHKRIGTLPKFKDIIKTSLNPSNYVEVKRNRNAIWIKHVDAISSLSLSEDKSLLYSSSWDKTIKVWRMSDSKCLESINAHDDAVNSVVAGFNGLVFTGSADGTIKVWRREMLGKTTKHFFFETLLKQESAITALAVNASATALYSGSSDGMLNFWARDKVLAHGGVLRGHKLAVLCVETAGNLVFSGSADMKICVWRKDGGDHVCLSVLSGHSGPVKCLAVEQQDKEATSAAHPESYIDKHYMVYSGSLDKSVKIWRVSSEMITAACMQIPQLSTPPHQPYFPAEESSVQMRFGRSRH